MGRKKKEPYFTKRARYCKKKCANAPDYGWCYKICFTKGSYLTKFL